MKLKKYFFAGALICSTLVAIAQNEADDMSMDDLYALSLEELMNVRIKSASKKDETLFDAPLSSYTITKAEIEKSGVTSIMEALRLAPGVIVREISNGMYDVHIRGLENLTRTNGVFMKPNVYTLVMVDNRPVFNHGMGGTYYESLTVDLNDVERIEVVRGPSSPLFGPNAVTGVINIITKRMDNDSVLVNASVQGGTLGTVIANATVGKKFSDKFSAIISANMQNRARVDEQYYDVGSGSYVDLNDMIADPAMRNALYPDPSRSLKRWGVNGYFNYAASEDVVIDLSLATQKADFQKVFITPMLTDGTTDNTSANLGITIHDLHVRASHLIGHSIDLRSNAPYVEYDFTVSDVIAEYNIKLGEKSSVTPGVSYQHGMFDDLDYVGDGIIGLFNSSSSISSFAGYIRSDINFTDKFRVLGGLRLDKFSKPDDAYLAYELAATYKVTEKNLVRAALTRSNSGSFIGYNYVNFVSGTGNVQGNTNLQLFTLDMIEVGFRSQLSDKLQFDIDIFRQKGENLTAVVQTAGPQVFSNTPTTATQLGATISFNYVPNDKIQFKPFITIQKTETEDLPSYYLDPTLPSPPFPTVTYSNSTHEYTPGSYGGFYFNYRVSSKLNVNLNSYYFTNHTQYDQSYDVADTSTPQYANGQIAGKFLVSAKVSYEAAKNLHVFVNARNLLGDDAREFYAADRTAGLYTAGLQYRMNK